MKSLACLGIFLFALSGWAAITAPPTRRAQNFIVQDLRGNSPSSINLKSEEGAQWVKLDLDVLALSTERLHQALSRELDVSTRGSGRILLCLVTATAADQGIRIVATPFADGWHYRVDVPDQIEQLKLIRGIVEVLLLELANRSRGPKSAEIPSWLNEGLSMQLMATMGPDLILQSVPVGSMLEIVRNVGGSRDAGGLDRLRQARAVLRTVAPATLAELGHPALETLKGESMERFQSSAQLFVAELCRLPNGRACLVNLLQELPWCWNWETAFLRAYRRYFARTLDVEKWWSVVLTSFTGRDPSQVWAAEICFDKLDEILLKPAQVRLSPDVMPVRTYVTPQQIIADWDFASQKAALDQTLLQLAILRVNCPLDIAALIERYRLTFQNYLQKRGEASSTAPTKGQALVSIPVLMRETIDRLDELYRQREALRRAYAAAAAATAPSPQP